MSKKSGKKEREIHWMSWHGKLGDEKWPHPVCVARTNKVNRKDQGNKTNASEYVDHDDVLDAKMKIIADLIRKSKFCVVYTGAGISRGAGIPDYGSKAENSIANEVEELDRPEYALPTYSHYCLSNLEEEGLIQYYIQQNHDGLPQKAGFPQEKMNEIHGAWFDPSNPVVQFSEKLRSDLFRAMYSIEEKIDLTLCMGTSLSGMNADRVVTTPCEKFAGGVEGCNGSVIINLQFTPVDIPGYVPIRVWAKIDDAMKLLMNHLGLEMRKRRRKWEELEIEEDCDCVICPYNKKGQHDDDKRMILDMSIGQKVMISNPKAKNYGEKGFVRNKDKHGHYDMEFDDGIYTLGKWWLVCAREGRVQQLPVTNLKPKFAKKKKKEKKKKRKKKLDEEDVEE